MRTIETRKGQNHPTHKDTKAGRAETLRRRDVRAVKYAGGGTMSAPREAVLDVWLKFDAPDDDEASHEANTWRTSDGFRVEWCHTAVGQITCEQFPTYALAREWLTGNGYQDFTS